MALNPELDDIRRTLQRLREQGVIPAVAGPLLTGRDAFIAELGPKDNGSALSCP